MAPRRIFTGWFCLIQENKIVNTPRWDTLRGKLLRVGELARQCEKHQENWLRGVRYTGEIDSAVWDHTEESDSAVWEGSDSDRISHHSFWLYMLPSQSLFPSSLAPEIMYWFISKVMSSLYFGGLMYPTYVNWYGTSPNVICIWVAVEVYTMVNSHLASKMQNTSIPEYSDDISLLIYVVIYYLCLAPFFSYLHTY